VWRVELGRQAVPDRPAEGTVGIEQFATEELVGGGWLGKGVLALSEEAQVAGRLLRGPVSQIAAELKGFKLRAAKVPATFQSLLESVGDPARPVAVCKSLRGGRRTDRYAEVLRQ
jgi:hypothetical protein